MTGFELWCDVFDAAWQGLGDGPVLLRGAAVQRLLDGKGSITLQAVMDERTLNLLVEERRVRVYTLQPSGTVYELGRGIITSVSKSWSDGGWLMTAQGDDILAELSRTIVYKSFTTPVSLVSYASDLLNEADWLVEVSDAADIEVSGRLYGVSVLKALLDVAEQKGLHLRIKYSADPTANPTMQIGAFGGERGVLLMNSDLSPEVYDAPLVGLIQQLTADGNSQQIANSVVAIGGGEGEAAVTLARSTRSGNPYPIVTKTYSNGPTVYLVENTASIGVYGRIQKSLVFKNILPAQNSESAKINAANDVYDGAAAWLARNGEPQTSYSVSAVALETRVQPGDVVRVAYNGDILKEDGTYEPQGDLNGDFYVVGLTERATETGLAVDMQVSNVLQRLRDESAVVVEAIENIQLRSRQPMTQPYQFNDSWVDSVQSLTSPSPKTALFTIPIPGLVTDVFTVLARFKTLPLDAGLGSITARNAGLGVEYAFSEYCVGTHQYYPHQLSMSINGVDVTSALGGPWGSYTTSATVDLDITEYIVNASGGLYQNHEIEFNCVNQGVTVSTAGPATSTTAPPGWSIIIAGGGLTSAESRGRILFSVQVLGATQAIRT